MHSHTAPDFGRVAPEHAATFLGIMSLLHGEPVAPAFGRLLKKRLEPDDYMLLAHIFEEVSVLALHHLIPEALLFDAFAFDLYWDELREDILSLRRQTGNEKFCETSRSPRTAPVTTGANVRPSGAGATSLKVATRPIRLGALAGVHRARPRSLKGPRRPDRAVRARCGRSAAGSSASARPFAA